MGEPHERGVAANNAGRYATARRLLARAQTLAESSYDTETVALVESSLAHLEAETGDWLAALARCDALLDRRGLTDRTRARRSRRARAHPPGPARWWRRAASFRRGVEARSRTVRSSS